MLSRGCMTLPNARDVRATLGILTIHISLIWRTSDDVVRNMFRRRRAVLADKADLALRLENSPLDIGKPADSGKAHLGQYLVARQSVTPKICLDNLPIFDNDARLAFESIFEFRNEISRPAQGQRPESEGADCPPSAPMAQI